jgi:hypothetical protein
MCVPDGGVAISNGDCGTSYTFPSAENQALVSYRDSAGNLHVDFRNTTFTGGGGGSVVLIEGNLIDINSSNSSSPIISVDLSEAPIGAPAVYGASYVIGNDGQAHLLPAVSVASAETALTTLGSSTINLVAGTTGNGHTGLSASVRLDPSLTNLTNVTATGLLTTITPTLIATSLNGGVAPTAGAYNVSVNGSGLPSLTVSLAGGGTETSVTANTTASIILNAAGTANHTLSSEIVGYAGATIGHHPTKGNAGIVWVAPATFTETPLTVNNTNNTVLLGAGTTGNGHTGLTANVRIDPAAGNALQSSISGLFVPTAGITNLGYTPAITQGTVTSSSGANAILPVVNSTNAGLATPIMLANTHPAASTTNGASVSFTTNVSSQNISAEINNYASAGFGQIPSKTAGGITWVTPAAGGGVGTTNLSYIASASNGVVVSDTGIDATLPLVNSTNAGLATPAMFNATHVAMTTIDGASIDFVTSGVNNQTVTAEIVGYVSAVAGTVLTKTAGGVTWSTVSGGSPTTGDLTAQINGAASTQISVTGGVNSVIGASGAVVNVSNFVGTTASVIGKAGLVPAPVVGEMGEFLRGDGTWAVPTMVSASTAIVSRQVEADWFTTAGQTSNLSPILFINDSGAVANGVMTAVMFSLNGAGVNAGAVATSVAAATTTIELLRNGVLVPTAVPLTLAVGARKMFTTIANLTFNNADDLQVRYVTGDTNKHIMLEIALRS